MREVGEVNKQTRMQIEKEQVEKAKKKNLGKKCLRLGKRNPDEDTRKEVRKTCNDKRRKEEKCMKPLAPSTAN